MCHDYQSQVRQHKHLPDQYRTAAEGRAVLIEQFAVGHFLCGMC